VPNTVAYTGTHDNNTTLGWWKDGVTEEERAHAQTYLRPIEHECDIVGAMMRAAAASVANLCIFPHAGRPRPGQRGAHEYAGRRRWKLDLALSRRGSCIPELRPQLAALMEMTDRDGYRPGGPGREPPTV
jgi:4-alpha-glucanotransferase